ncbi:MAG: ribonuclease III [Peptococcaceae bacterium]|nr:ribonuclease III [Peptococcaceae bacterium]
MSDWNSIFRGDRIDQPHMLSPLVLAYIGDAVYELWVRRHVIARGVSHIGKLHSEAVRYVCADTQAGVLKAIEDTLTGEEANIARRGRNAKQAHTPRGRVAAYHQSTGLECLVGYLFLLGNMERLAEIMEKIFRLVDGDNLC